MVVLLFGRAFIKENVGGVRQDRRIVCVLDGLERVHRLLDLSNSFRPGLRLQRKIEATKISVQWIFNNLACMTDFLARTESAKRSAAFSAEGPVYTVFQTDVFSKLS